MSITLYEQVTGKKFQRTSESLAFLFEDFERLKNDPDTTLWRMLVAQSLDFYHANLQWGTLEDAISVYADEPALTGHAGLDAAAAAIALYIADRDGWPAPAWARNPARKSPQPWYVANRPIPRKFADKETPKQFRKLNVFITEGALRRA